MKKLLALFIVAASLYASVNVTVNGSTHVIPQTSERGWGNAVTAWIQAISGATLQKNGGSFTLTNDVDFGSTYGLKAGYFISKSSNVPSSGTVRLAYTDTIVFRNAANTGNLSIGGLLADYLSGVGSSVKGISDTATLTNKTLNAIGNGTAYGTLYLDGSKNLASVNGTTGQFLKSNGAGAAPSYDSASGTLSYVTSDTNYALTTANDTLIVPATASRAPTLPQCSGAGGKVFTVKKTAGTITQLVTITPYAGDTIDGASTYVLYTVGESLRFQCDGGTNWVVLDHRTITEWTAYTPTGNMTTNVVYTGFWRRVGDSAEITARMTFSGATDSTIQSISVPSGMTIDTAKYLSTGQYQSLGVANAQDNNASLAYTGTVGQNGTDEVLFWGYNTASWSNTVPFTIAASDTITANFTVPISGWKN